MNNKGFAISSVLFTILICFLLFLGATLAIFSSSNSIVVAANDDIINGTKFKAVGIVLNGDDVDQNYKIKIISRYGIAYYPKDFTDEYNNTYKNIKADITGDIVTFSDNITEEAYKCTVSSGVCEKIS